MNTQEAYEQQRAYFTRPGAERALDESGDPAYRNRDGCGCAVGCLIPDNLYDRTFEGVGIGLLLRPARPGDIELRAVWERAAALRAWFDGVDRRYLDDTQVAHDREAESVEEFVVLLDRTARSYGLAVPR